MTDALGSARVETGAETVSGSKRATPPQRRAQDDASAHHRFNTCLTIPQPYHACASVHFIAGRMHGPKEFCTGQSVDEPRRGVGEYGYCTLGIAPREIRVTFAVSQVSTRRLAVAFLSMNERPEHGPKQEQSLLGDREVEIARAFDTLSDKVEHEVFRMKETWKNTGVVEETAPSRLKMLVWSEACRILGISASARHEAIFPAAEEDRD